MTEAGARECEGHTGHGADASLFLKLRGYAIRKNWRGGTQHPEKRPRWARVSHTRLRQR